MQGRRHGILRKAGNRNGQVMLKQQESGRTNMRRDSPVLVLITSDVTRRDLHMTVMK